MPTLLNKVEDTHIGTGLSKNLEGHVRKNSSYLKTRWVGFEGLTQEKSQSYEEADTQKKGISKVWHGGHR